MTPHPPDDASLAQFLEPNTRVRVREHGVAWRTVFDEVIALNSESSQYHAVNATGRSLWQMIDRGTSVDELVATLTRAHPDAEPRAGADVARFLADLHVRGLIEMVPPTP